jgi:TolB-like protein
VTGEKLDAAAFTDLLASASAQLETFKVLSTQEMATILGAERQRQLTGCSDDTSCMSEIGQALGAGLLLQASIGKVGDTYLITARLVDAARARVLSRGSLQTRSADLLLKGLWQVAEQVFDGYGATLSGEAAERFSRHPKLTPPTALTQSDHGPSRPTFGASLNGVFGYQPLSVASHRSSLGGEVYATMRAGRLDVGVGAAIAPSPGARLSVMVALIDSRFRLDVGLRGAAYFGLGVYGGGLGAQGEFAITSWFSAQLWAAGEVYPVAGSVVIAVLGGAGVGAHF